MYFGSKCCLYSQKISFDEANDFLILPYRQKMIYNIWGASYIEAQLKLNLKKQENFIILDFWYEVQFQVNLNSCKCWKCCFHTFVNYYLCWDVYGLHMLFVCTYAVISIAFS